MPISSNITTIINLAEIGRLDLLDDLFGKICVPPAVEGELVAKRALFPNTADAENRFEVITPA